jgi:hypothetical protein
MHWEHVWHTDQCVEWNMNLWMNECHMNFASSYNFVLNVFSMHNINVWNVWITNEWILHYFHY